MNKNNTLIFSMILLIAILFIPQVYAFEFDNIKIYDDTIREVTIKNCDLWIGTCLIDGEDLAKVKLLSDLNVEVGAGYQKVAEFEITSYQQYEQAIKTLELYNMKDGMKPIERQVDFKFKTAEQVEVLDYVTECKTEDLTEEELKNQTLTEEQINNGTKLETTKEVCNQVQRGSHFENKEVWNDKLDMDMKAESMTIGLFTDVEAGDKVEWIPNLYGVRVEEWASFQQSTAVGLVSYYRLDETSGTMAMDDMIRNHGVSDMSINLTGKIGTSYNSTTNLKKITISPTDFPKSYNSPVTYCLWVNGKAGGDYANLIGLIATGSNQIAIDISSDTSVSNKIRMEVCKAGTGCNVALSPSALPTGWVHVCGSFDGTGNANGIKLYLNGTNVANETYSYGSVPNGAGNFMIGAIPTWNGFLGQYDEVGIWNRSLTATEITELYNSGTGLQNPRNDFIWDNYNLSTNLVSYYKLDETTGTTTFDILSVNNLTNTGASINQVGIINTAYNFSNAPSYLSKISPAIPTSANGSVSVWVNLTANPSADASIFTFNENTDGSNNYYDYGISTTGKIYWNDGCNIITNNSIELNKWQNIIFVANNGQAKKVYVNGVLSPYTITYGGCNTSKWNINSTNYNRFNIGVLARGTQRYNVFMGKIDEFGIWNNTLSDIQVQALYNYSSALIYGSSGTSAPTITMNTASQNLTEVQVTTINMTVKDAIKVQNVSLYVNGVLNQTNTSGLNNTNYLFNVTLGDGTYTILGNAWNNQSLATNSSAITIIVESTHPIITANLSNSTLYILGGNLTLNYNVTHSPNLTGVSAWYNYNGTNRTLNTSLSSINFTTATGQYNLTLYANDSVGNQATPVSLNFSLDAIAPQTTLNYPTSLITYGAVNGTLQLNFSATDYNLDKVWYNYNGTNVTIAGALTGVVNLSNITLSTKKNVTIYANDTAGNLNETTYSWDYKVFENSRTWNNDTYESAYQNFSISLNGTETINSVNLVINSTLYPSTDMGGGIYNNTNLQIPKNSFIGNHSLYWIIEAGGIDYNTTINTLQVTKNPHILNLTFSSANNVTIFGILNGTYTNVTNVVKNMSDLPYGEIIIHYNVQEAGGRQEYVFTNTWDTNITETLELFDTFQLLQLRTLYVSEAVKGVLINIYKNVAGVWKIIGSGYSDETGSLATYVEPDQNLRFTTSATGYVSETLDKFIYIGYSDVIVFNLETTSTIGGITDWYSTCPTITTVNESCDFGVTLPENEASIEIRYWYNNESFIKSCTNTDSCELNNILINNNTNYVNASLYLNGIKYKSTYSVKFYDTTSKRIQIGFSITFIEAVKNNGGVRMFYIITLIAGFIMWGLIETRFKGMGKIAFSTWCIWLALQSFTLYWIPVAILTIIGGARLVKSNTN